MSAQGDCEFLVNRARELVEKDLWAAKAWLITARSLYPADFNIQVGAGRRFASALRWSRAVPRPAPSRAAEASRAILLPVGWPRDFRCSFVD